MSDLLSQFADAVARCPDRVAIVDGKKREVTFAQLHQRSTAFAAAWQAKGIRAGDRVLLAMSVDADLYAALAALWMLGATAVLPEPAMGLAGLRHAAKVTGARAFCSSGVYGLLKWALPELWLMRHLRPSQSDSRPSEFAPPLGTDIALISFTSGTTGTPKAIPRSHDFLEAQHHAIAPLLNSGQNERDLVAFPVFVLINIASGRTSVLPNWKMSRLSKLTASQLHDWIRTQNVTRALLPPSLCDKLAATKIGSGLHTVFTGGGPVFPDLIDKLQVAKPALRIVCVYGSTEAEPIAHLDAADIKGEDRAAMHAGKGLLVGPPVDHIRVRIEGHEIQVSGAHVNAGYLDLAHEAENKIRDGNMIWHRTGDAGYLDRLGRLWLLGRSGSQVQIDKSDIYPFSIEVAARQWPGVTQCALMEKHNAACLFIEGDKQHEQTWQSRAAAFGIKTVIYVAAMPMDNRHASKIDRKALAVKLG